MSENAPERGGAGSASRPRPLPAVLACLAGAGLTLYAVTRVWAVAIEQRPGLPDLRTEQTGADVQPWLIGLAVVALAGTGALLATRGVVRRLLGVLLMLTAAGIVAGAVLARVTLDPGASGVAGSIWPVLCVVGGAAVGVGGLLAARHGHEWPAMSSRYERRAPAEARSADGTRELWDALDRGDDPTAPGPDHP